MKKFLLLTFVLLMAISGLTALAQDVVLDAVVEYGSNLPQGYGTIRVDDVVTAVVEREPILLDVREVAEYEAGHIPGSFNVPIRTLAQNLALLPDQDAEIIVICKGGARAMMAQASLRILGYNKAMTFAGGYDAWAGEELEVTTDAFVPEAAEAPAIDPALLAAIDSVLSGLPEGYDLVSATNLAAELVEQAPILIDVRSAEEYAAGYIEGAQHLWINDFVANLDQLPADKDAAIVVYCGGGWRGGIAKIFMDLLGYTNVRNLSGGVSAWKAAELPLVGVPFDLASSLTEYVAGMPETFNAIRVDDLKTELDSGAELFVLDVRTVDEYTEGHIEGAVNVPLNELTDHLDVLPALDAPFVVVCGSGHRSALAMTALNLLGYSNARSMLSGMSSWTAKEYPVVQEPTEGVAGTAPAFDADLFAAVDGFVKSIPAGYWTVKAADLSVELVENPPVLVDVRSDGEFAAGAIEGALHIPLADFMTRLAEMPTDLTTAIVLYDNPTHRSTIAMSLLRMLGYENVRVLGGGVGAWEKAELPLVVPVS
ncbi:MAG: rhodanese-like domain-containing protein [Chloroflexi bacterium]|nr:rhodanese-like domain-containing protein [Chloroflexota bacterium]